MFSGEIGELRPTCSFYFKHFAFWDMDAQEARSTSTPKRVGGGVGPVGLQLTFTHFVLLFVFCFYF